MNKNYRITNYHLWFIIGILLLSNVVHLYQGNKLKDDNELLSKKFHSIYFGTMTQTSAMNDQINRLKEENDGLKDEVEILREINNINPIKVTAYEKELLASLVYCESGNQPFEGKVLTAQSVLNRSRVGGWWGNDIKSVIYCGNGSQYNGIRTSKFKNRKYNDDDIKAVEVALNKTTDLDIFYFFNPVTSGDTKFVNSKMKDVVYEIGQHVYTR